MDEVQLSPETQSKRWPRDRTAPAGAWPCGPESESWRLNREAFLLLGAGPRALLLQIAHPLVAEGVDQHSTFRDDPWARLRSTLASYLRIVYARPGTSREEIRRLNELHAGVAGPVRDPDARALADSYRARDPDLALWVHATLIESTMTVYDAWFEHLTRPRRASYYAETLPVGRAFGIPDRLLPPDLGAFGRYWSSMLSPGGPIRVTPTARSLATTIVHPPLGPLPAPLYDWLLWPAIALLPARLRVEYGIDWDPWHAFVAGGLRAGLTTWARRLPHAIRWMPQARAADRRARLETNQRQAKGVRLDATPAGAGPQAPFATIGHT